MYISHTVKQREARIANNNVLFARVAVRNCIKKSQHEISNNVVCATSKGSDQPAHTCSLIRAIASRLNIL